MIIIRHWLGSGIFAVLCVGILAAPAHAAARSVVPAAIHQRTFETQKAAADALITAAERYDLTTLKEILGPDGDKLVDTTDPVQDKKQLAAFAAKARQKSTIVPDAKNPNLAILSVGDEDWPLPIPIVRKSKTWSFDSRAGQREVLYRRIGVNELSAIEICRSFVEAQHEYALHKHDGSRLNQYAQRNISTPGRHDGLAWRNPDETWGGPLGEEVASAIAEGYSIKAPSSLQPYHGYYFKVMKGQGPAAPLGAIDFVIKGAMLGGFALLAVPAEYRVTGVKTFIVSHDGVVYEKDLGPKTLERFLDMELYNPDKTWRRTD